MNTQIETTNMDTKEGSILLHTVSIDPTKSGNLPLLKKFKSDTTLETPDELLEGIKCLHLGIEERETHLGNLIRKSKEESLRDAILIGQKTEEYKKIIGHGGFKKNVESVMCYETNLNYRKLFRYKDQLNGVMGITEGLERIDQIRKKQDDDRFDSEELTVISTTPQNTSDAVPQNPTPKQSIKPKVYPMYGLQLFKDNEPVAAKSVQIEKINQDEKLKKTIVPQLEQFVESVERGEIQFDGTLPKSVGVSVTKYINSLNDQDKTTLDPESEFKLRIHVGMIGTMEVLARHLDRVIKEKRELEHRVQSTPEIPV